MTGFGVGQAEDSRFCVRAEIRSVNHRGLSVRTNLPPECAVFETAVESVVRSRVTRGAITCGVVLEPLEDAQDNSHSPLDIDEAAFVRHAKALRDLADLAGTGAPRFETILALPGVSRKVDRLPPPEELVLEATRAALADLDASRAREGAILTRELLGYLDRLEASLGAIEQHVPAVVAAYEERLEQRIVDFLTRHGQTVDSVDVLREVALYADKVDVKEETVRFRAHLDEFRRLLTTGGDGESPRHAEAHSVGRRPEFLSQELLREANTIAAKSGDVLVAREVVEIKATLDRIREQGQNLE